MTSRGPHTGAALELVEVSQAFGPVIAVDGVSLAVPPGEFLTLLGPSGSGKTTTLMMIAGFESATAGEILLGGRPLTRVPPYRRNLGMVFQHYALFPHMTVHDNVAFPLRTRGVTMAETDRRGEGGLDRVHLPRYGARFPAPLSPGPPQRVAPPRAPLHPPPVLLLDHAPPARPPRLPSPVPAKGGAARRARQEAARADAARDQAHPAGASAHRDLRHARPGRGADHVGSHCGHAPRSGGTAGPAGGPLRASG